MTTFDEDHAAGAHQAEIVQIMTAMEPAFYGHPRAICVFALSRMIAVMLGPAMPETREHMLVELPLSIRAILAEMDRMMAASQ
jgi:hypothetical protein